jgi:hypothetical protein
VIGILPGAASTGGGRAAPGARPARLLPVAAVLAALALSVSGCSSAVDGRAGAAGPAPTAAAPTPAATTAPVGTAPSTPSAVPEVDVAADGLRPFLLTPQEVGPGFAEGDEPQPDPQVPAVCGGPGVVAQFPSAVRVGAGFTGPVPESFVQETVSVYGDVATAEAAYRATLDGLACSDGTLADTPVVLTPAEDLGADVPGDESTGWRIGGPGFDVVLIAVRSGELVVNFAFFAPEGGSADLPDPLVVARAGVEKLAG